MDLQTQTKTIMSKGIKNFATLNHKGIKDVQVLISTDDEKSCTPKYELLLNHKPIKVITFNEILNVKIDFLGREMIATPFIANTIRRLAREIECEFTEINVLIYADTNDENNVLMYCFKGTEPVKPITFEYLFEGM